MQKLSFKTEKFGTHCFQLAKSSVLKEFAWIFYGFVSTFASERQKMPGLLLWSVLRTVNRRLILFSPCNVTVTALTSPCCLVGRMLYFSLPFPLATQARRGKSRISSVGHPKWKNLVEIGRKKYDKVKHHNGVRGVARKNLKSRQFILYLCHLWLLGGLWHQLCLSEIVRASELSICWPNRWDFLSWGRKPFEAPFPLLH